MNTEIARTHVCALIDGHLDEATADKLFADSDFIRLEIEKVISKVSTAAAGRPITGEIQEAGLQQYTEEFLARLQQQYPRNFQDD